MSLIYITRTFSASSDYLVYYTTGVELADAENYPKFFNTKLKEAKRYAKGNPDYDSYRGVYNLLPTTTTLSSQMSFILKEPASPRTSETQKLLTPNLMLMERLFAPGWQRIQIPG